MADYKTPGVYVEETPKLPASVAQVSTAIPAFIGYTKLHPQTEPKRITSFVEYVELFGAAVEENITITVDGLTANALPVAAQLTSAQSPFRMYYAVQLYFANGGGPCYIVSVGNYSATIGATALGNGLGLLEKEDEPTLILFPDIVGSAMTTAAGYGVYANALAQCEKLKDRFTIIDLYEQSDSDSHATFRTNIGVLDLKYGAAYYPWLQTSLPLNYNATTTVTISQPTGPLNNQVLSAQSNVFINMAQVLINQLTAKMPPGPAIAGIYASVDRSRGVWKAPANVSLNAVIKPTKKITDDVQEEMNVHSTGKSINAIRLFTGQGTLVWGARTLAGNDNEWRYVPVRRFFNMVEESIKKATEFVVFESNDANTWVRVRGTIQNYLTGLWRQGALAGAKPEDAFFVNVGLGETMTSVDILEGRLIVEIGMAAVRPAEFIVLRFSHKLQES